MTKKGALTTVIICLLSIYLSACVGLISDFDFNYKITFNTGIEGVTIDPIYAKAGEEINAPEPPAREGYRFDGWTENGKVFVFYTMPARNVRLTAKWTKLYKVTFNTAGGTAIEPVYLGEGEKINIGDPSRANHIFMGWTLNGGYIDLSEFFMPAEDITLTAVWMTGGVTISFNTGTSSVQVDPISAKPGTPVSEPRPSRPGYKFMGWYLGNSLYKFTVMPQASITLNAKWARDAGLPIFWIDIKDSNGNMVSLNTIINHRGFGVPYNQDYFDCETIVENLPGNTRIFDTGFVRGRGNGSWTDSSLKSFRFKFNKKQSLLGMVPSKHWILHASRRYDNNLFKDYSSKKIAKDILDGLDYAGDAHYIDLYFNGEFQGVYVLMEHVRVAEGRIEIESVPGVSNTGYLLQLDSYADDPYRLGGVTYYPEENVDYVKVDDSGWYPWVIESPELDDYLEAGLTKNDARTMGLRIKQEITDLVYPLLSINSSNGAQKYAEFLQRADKDSFIDMYILHELYKNTDTGWSSFFVYKPAGNNQKFYCGAPWDFDFSAGNSRGDSGYTGIYVGESVLWSGYDTWSRIYVNLWKVQQFRVDVANRWKVVGPQIKNYLNNQLGPGFIDQYDDAIASSISNWPSKVNTIRNWLLNRIDWLTNSGFNY